jgi:hypothetical protein
MARLADARYFFDFGGESAGVDGLVKYPEKSGVLILFSSPSMGRRNGDKRNGSGRRAFSKLLGDGEAVLFI